MSRIPNYPPPGGWGWEGRKIPRQDSASESFVNAIKNEARIDDRESPSQHAERLHHEVLDVLLKEGIQSQDEAIMLLAKLDIVIEASNDAQLKESAKEMQRDIKRRHPDLKRILNADI